jgi:hypothetical protein
MPPPPPPTSSVLAPPAPYALPPGYLQPNPVRLPFGSLPAPVSTSVGNSVVALRFQNSAPRDMSRLPYSYPGTESIHTPAPPEPIQPAPPEVYNFPEHAQAQTDDETHAHVGTKRRRRGFMENERFTEIYEYSQSSTASKPASSDPSTDTHAYFVSNRYARSLTPTRKEQRAVMDPIAKGVQHAECRTRSPLLVLCVCVSVLAYA